MSLLDADVVMESGVEAVTPRKVDVGVPADGTTVIIKAAALEITKELAKVVGIVERKHSLPICSAVLMRKDGARVLLTATDLDSQVEASAQVGVGDGSGQIAVEGRRLLDIVKSVRPEQEVTMTTHGEKLLVAAREVAVHDELHGCAGVPADAKRHFRQGHADLGATAWLWDWPGRLRDGEG